MKVNTLKYWPVHGFHTTVNDMDINVCYYFFIFHSITQICVRSKLAEVIKTGVLKWHHFPILFFGFIWLNFHFLCILINFPSFHFSVLISPWSLLKQSGEHTMENLCHICSPTYPSKKDLFVQNCARSTQTTWQDAEIILTGTRTSKVVSLSLHIHGC